MAAAGTGRGEPGECGGPLAPHQVQLRAWLRPADGSRGLRLTKVHDLLAHQGVGVPYSSLHRYVVEHCGFQDVRRPTVRVANVASGELAEVDFGRLGLVSDPATGRRRLVHALIVTLVRSRHQYVHVTTSQKLADLIAGLEDAWEFFGGVVRRVVLESSLETIRRMINRQRDACVLQLQRIVKRKGEPVRAAGSASSFMRALLIEAAEFHLQAELKWLSHVERDVAAEWGRRQRRNPSGLLWREGGRTAPPPPSA